jgi:phosphate transport system protein
MAPKEVELQLLKSDMINMWKLVSEQMKRSMRALVSGDLDLAQQVIASEKQVNFLEIKVNSDCENIFALFNPVAVDLRLVLALLRINTNLERIGDIAASVSKFVIRSRNESYALLLDHTRTLEMFEEACDLVDGVLESFEQEDSEKAKIVFKRDKMLNEINKSARKVIIEHIKQNPQEVEHCLAMLSIVRKLERAGDQTKNIAEEIIYYVEAKVVKHMSKDDKDGR